MVFSEQCNKVVETNSASFSFLRQNYLDKRKYWKEAKFPDSEVQQKIVYQMGDVALCLILRFYTDIYNTVDETILTP